MQFGAKNWVNFKYKLLQILDIFLQRKEIRGFRPWIDGEEYVRPPHFCLGLKRPSPPPLSYAYDSSDTHKVRFIASLCSIRLWVVLTRL